MAAIAIMAVISARLLPMFKSGMQEADRVAQTGRNFGLAFKGDVIQYEEAPSLVKEKFSGRQSSSKNDIILKIEVERLSEEDKKNIRRSVNQFVFIKEESGNLTAAENLEEATSVYYVP